MLHWRELDGEWVVLFDAGSVVCHLDGFNAAVLTLIEDGEGDAQAIAQQIASGAVVDDLAALSRKVADVCEALYVAGLIESVDS